METPSVLLLALAMLLASGARAQEAASPAPLLERLLEIPDGVTVHQTSSRNREGWNGDDGWRLHDDARGDAVTFDAAGPGCVRSIWSTDIREDAVLHFYLDGESEPRWSVPMLAFFRGEHPLFPAPLASLERRGYWGERPFAGKASCQSLSGRG